MGVPGWDMEGRREEGAILVGGDAATQLYGSRGIGRPAGGGTVALTWVEAAYALARGDIDGVDGADARRFFADAPDDGALTRFIAYRDLRGRGYYVATAYAPGEDPPATGPALLVRPRGAEPTGDEVAYRLHVRPEYDHLTPADLEPGTLAIVDDEAEVTYVAVGSPSPSGSWRGEEVPRAEGALAADRVLVFDPPPGLHEAHYFGQPLDDGSILGLNLLEADYLASRGRLELAADPGERGRAIDGDAFERRREVYGRLRDAGAVPRSGLKFGADFRVYGAVPTDDEPGHSTELVEVVAPTRRIPLRSIARAVRLATGVRKSYRIASVDGATVRWRSIERLTP